METRYDDMTTVLFLSQVRVFPFFARRNAIARFWSVEILPHVSYAVLCDQTIEHCQYSDAIVFLIQECLVGTSPS